MKTSLSLAALAPALVAAQAQIKSIHKDASNPFFKSKFASYDNIVSQVRPILAANGLALLQGVEHPETNAGELGCFNVTTTLLHLSGEWIQTDVVVPVGKDGGKLSPTQVAGAALTYGRRYGLSALLALSTDDDTDGAETGGPRRKAADAPPPRPAVAADPLVMPFGNKTLAKGTRNTDVPTDKLTAALLWAREKGKYPEWQVQADAELARRLDALLGRKS